MTRVYRHGDCVCPSFQVTTGGMCPPGHYCPEGTGYPIPCDGGKYCDRAKLAEPTGTKDVTEYATSKSYLLRIQFTLNYSNVIYFEYITALRVLYLSTFQVTAQRDTTAAMLVLFQTSTYVHPVITVQKVQACLLDVPTGRSTM